ncbi:hypothetical protein GV936_13660 [Salmonella enterica]|nr:hypothetical protein [Salmonella enterica]EEK2699700.1 hypothetical protein [Salmonella enterica subsp. enterica serovar Newport]
MTKSTRGRPCRFNEEQLAHICYEFYKAEKGKESREQVLNEHGISIAQFYKSLKKLNVEFFIRVNGGEITPINGV